MTVVVAVTIIANVGEEVEAAHRCRPGEDTQETG